MLIHGKQHNGWPAHRVSFRHGNDDDDYCFAYDRAGHPWVAYWSYDAPVYSDEAPGSGFAGGS